MKQKQINPDPSHEFNQLKQEYMRQEAAYATYLRESKKKLYGCRDVLERHTFFMNRYKAYKPLGDVYMRLRSLSKQCKIGMQSIRESFEKFRRTHNNTLTSIKRYEDKLQRIEG
ncbi:serine protease [Helicobacter sp. NHP22-001]|uniref:serine protease n=1 Tax=Helicobacter sp. NHP22-001 TaxID=3040202 RepID=UPI00244D8BE1|nr:serine protease [Helicobacter sp. NHP22-001]GMB95524.1 hypothetical protein NHP22001_01130 [Helicobacter sp. NHP22-001]